MEVNNEIPKYIHHKIRLAGGSDTMLDGAALSALTTYCKGSPRIIDNVMTAAMIAGAQNNKTTIDSEVMLAAINEQSLV